MRNQEIPDWPPPQATRREIIRERLAALGKLSEPVDGGKVRRWRHGQQAMEIGE